MSDQLSVISGQWSVLAHWLWAIGSWLLPLLAAWLLATLALAVFDDLVRQAALDQRSAARYRALRAWYRLHPKDWKRRAANPEPGTVNPGTPTI